MNWTTSIILVVIALTVFWLKRRGQLSSKDAVRYLKAGALVIDVRSNAEFATAHLPMAINIPLDSIGKTTPSRIPDKDKVLLLHCQSGMRSGMARRKLQTVGYKRVFNLGSYARAVQLTRIR